MGWFGVDGDFASANIDFVGLFEAQIDYFSRFTSKFDCNFDYYVYSIEFMYYFFLENYSI